MNKVNNTRDMSAGSSQYPVEGGSFFLSHVAWSRFHIDLAVKQNFLFFSFSNFRDIRGDNESR